MFLSASRRTDIPAFFSSWFFERLEEGFLVTQNPMNKNQMNRVSLSPETVDCIVFWTKNPKPMLTKLDKLKDYLYYFQYTLNPYGKDIEMCLPGLSTRINTFIDLSKKLGKDRVIWRYDPIILNPKYTKDFHIKTFCSMAEQLAPYTKRVSVGFVHPYRKVQGFLENQHVLLREEDKEEIAFAFSDIAHSHGLTIDACGPNMDWQRYGIEKAHCIDLSLIEKLAGCKMDGGKDPNQRTECGCATSIDVGMYHTCKNGCLYCYANSSHSAAIRNAAKHQLHSPLLIGTVEGTVKLKNSTSNKRAQQTLWEHE